MLVHFDQLVVQAGGVRVWEVRDDTLRIVGHVGMGDDARWRGRSPAGTVTRALRSKRAAERELVRLTHRELRAA